MRLLSIRGHRTKALALEYGVAETTIRRAIGIKHGAMGAPLRPLGPCVICRRTPTETKVRRFQLSIHPKRGASARGAGSIDLCEDDWKLHAKSRMRPRLKLDKLS